MTPQEAARWLTFAALEASREADGSWRMTGGRSSPLT